jgi:molecular chaperone GrpE
VSEQDRTVDPEREEQRGPTVRDRRRIDPETYQVREPQQSAAAPGPGAPAPQPSDQTETRESDVTVESTELAEARTALAERTADLQRLQAEYINYKRRVDRDRDVTRKAGIESVLKDFLPVLDDLRSAREHEELSGGFKAVADEVERVAAKHGLAPFGQAGDAFDPHIHEALLHAHATGITGPTCVEILQAGYRIGDKVLRPARVAVAEPGPEEAAAPAVAPPAAESQPEAAPVAEGAPDPDGTPEQ